MLSACLGILLGLGGSAQLSRGAGGTSSVQHFPGDFISSMCKERQLGLLVL